MTTDRMGRIRWSTVAIATMIAGLVIVAAVVRLIGIDFGRPFAYHPDEATIAKAAMRMVHDRTPHPGTFLYPSLLIDIQAVVTAIARPTGGGHLETGQGWLHGSEVLPHQFRYFLAGRYVVAGLALATIPVAFIAGSRLGGRIAGFTAATIVAVSPLHITSSRYLTTDVPVTLACLIVLVATVHAYQQRSVRWWIIAGLGAGLAGSTKWTGLAVVSVPLIGYALTVLRPTGLPSVGDLRVPVGIAVAAVIGVVVGTPTFLFDPGAVIEGIVRQGELYARVRPNERSESLTFHLVQLWDSLGPIVVVGALAGLVALALRRPRVGVVIPAYVLLHIGLISIPSTHFERNLLPVIPFLGVAVGIAVAGAARWLHARLAGNTRPEIERATRIAVALVGSAIVLMSLGPGLAAGWTEGRRLEGTDTRTIARDWILENIPRKSIVAREQYTPQLTPDEYRLRNHPFLWNRGWAWYREVGVEYLVTSSLSYVRFHGNPDAPAQDAFYAALFELPEVFRVDPAPSTPGWTVRIFRFPPADVEEGR